MGLALVALAVLAYLAVGLAAVVAFASRGEIDPKEPDHCVMAFVFFTLWPMVLFVLAMVGCGWLVVRLAGLITGPKSERE